MGDATVLVLGSVNYDLIVTQERLPRRGETFVASGFRGAFGGKGANQAVQAALLGATVRFLGSVGDDEYGRMSRTNLEQRGISAFLRPTDEPTGIGIVHVTGEGDVFATIVEGANGAVDVSWIDRHERLFAEASVVVLQNEIPDPSNARAIELAELAGTPVIYNAAPARPVLRRLTRRCTWFVVNEDEAAAYLRRPLEEPGDDDAMRRAVRELRDYCSNVVLTLGSRGCYVAAGEEIRFIPAVRTVAVDSTGAGDSWIGHR